MCIDLYCKNPHVLDPLRNVLILPSNRTIRYYKNKKEQKPGWNGEVIEWCYQEAQGRKLKECDYWGGLVLDEMKIEATCNNLFSYGLWYELENVEMVIKNGKHRLVGFIELGQLHKDMQEVEGKTGTQLASHVLQFIFLSDSGFRFPVAQFPSHDCSPSDLFFLFWQGGQMLMEYDFMIYWCILDGAEVNRQFIKLHFPQSDPVQRNFVAFNMYTTEPMVFIVDSKHNFKKIRNNIEKSKVRVKPRCLTVNGKRILWSQFVAAGEFNFDQKCNSLAIHENLTMQHFHLDPALRMRNHLAEQVLDSKMHYLMLAYQRNLAKDLNRNEDANSLEETIKFLQYTSKVVAFFTDKQAIHSVFDDCIKHLDDLLTYFNRWKNGTGSPKEFISDKLWFDVQSMIHGFKAITQIKLEKFPESVIKPWIINQDVVETISVKYVHTMGKTIFRHIDYRNQRKIQSDMDKNYQFKVQCCMLD